MKLVLRNYFSFSGLFENLFGGEEEQVSLKIR